MKELQKLTPDQEIKIQAQIKKEYKLETMMCKIKGLKLYSFDYKKGFAPEHIHEVPVTTTSILSLGDNKVNMKRKAHYNPNLYYFQALNMKVAVKKAKKWYELIKHLIK